MKTKIYNCFRDEVEIELKDNPIIAIFVVVLSGDETITVLYSDNSNEKFDSDKHSRCIDFFDGEYIVVGENIKKWLNYTPKGDGNKAYERMGIFDEEIEE